MSILLCFAMPQRVELDLESGRLDFDKNKKNTKCFKLLNIFERNQVPSKGRPKRNPIKLVVVEPGAEIGSGRTGDRCEEKATAKPKRN